MKFSQINADPKLPSLDITEPELGVQFEWDEPRGVLYVHVDGATVLRICRIKVPVELSHTTSIQEAVMPYEHFNDKEILAMRKTLTNIIGDLETMRTRIHDFSKQRLRKRLEGIQGDLATVIENLPADPAPTGSTTQPQGTGNGPRT